MTTTDTRHSRTLSTNQKTNPPNHNPNTTRKTPTARHTQPRTHNQTLGHQILKPSHQALSTPHPSPQPSNHTTAQEPSPQQWGNSQQRRTTEVFIRKVQTTTTTPTPAPPTSPKTSQQAPRHQEHNTVALSDTQQRTHPRPPTTRTHAQQPTTKQENVRSTP